MKECFKTPCFRHIKRLKFSENTKKVLKLVLITNLIFDLMKNMFFNVSLQKKFLKDKNLLLLPKPII